MCGVPTRWGCSVVVVVVVVVVVGVVHIPRLLFIGSRPTVKKGLIYKSSSPGVQHFFPPNGGYRTRIWGVSEGVTVRNFRLFAKNHVFSPPGGGRGAKRGPKGPKRPHFGLFLAWFRPVFRRGG